MLEFGDGCHSFGGSVSFHKAKIPFLLYLLLAQTI